MLRSSFARHVVRPAGTRVAPGLVLVSVLVSVLALARAGVALAADPSAAPSAIPSASPAPCGASFETWLDTALTPDPPPGQQIPIGLTVWDCAGGGFAFVDPVQVRVHPKTGSAQPATFPARSDWPGHFVTTIEVPAGGLGSVEAGVAGDICHDDGTCEPGFIPFETGGVGPPTAAPRSLLVTARIVPQADAIVAGRPFSVEVVIVPKADWAFDALHLPDAVVLVADLARGNMSWRSDARPTPGSAGAYTGTLTVDQPGDCIVHVAFPVEGEADQMIEGVTARVVVESDDGAAGPAPAAGEADASGGGPMPSWMPIAVGIAALAALALVIRRAFADL